LHAFSRGIFSFMRIAVLSLLLALPAGLLAAESPEAAAIRSLLTAQQQAWNRGDVRGFVEGYEQSDATTFVGTDVKRGWQKLLDRYREKYPTREKMGKLQFSEIEIRMLGAEYATVLGHWHLDRTAAAGGNVGGYFTLLLRKTPKGWKIFEDHTS
jgi:uncharacterized protein (TIGR02246 family)